MIAVVFEGVEDFEGVVGEVDFGILDLEMENDGVYALLEDGLENPCYELRFKAKSAWVEEIDAV